MEGGRPRLESAGEAWRRRRARRPGVDGNGGKGMT
jgi:hypothetical protein